MKTRLRGLADRAVARIRTYVGRYPIVKVVVPVVVLALVAALLLPPGSGPAPTPSSPIAQASPGTTPGATPATSPGATATPGPNPTATPEPWEALVLDPAVLVASITPEGETRPGVASNGRFTLRSLDGTPAAELAAGVTAEPAVEFAIVAGPTPDVVTLEPKEPLGEGQTYRLQLRTPDGTLGGAWAFRTQRPPRIVGTLPGDLGTDVPIRTGIEVSFDQDGTTGFESRFHIEPAVAGRFELHERTWVFVPEVPLAVATIYEVTVDPGVGLQGSELVNEEGVSFRFETEPIAAAPEVVIRFPAPMHAIRPGEEPVLAIYGASNAERRGGAAIKSLPVEIFRLPNLRTTLDAVAKLTGPDSWSLYDDDARVSTEGLRRIARLDAPVLVDQEGARLLSIPIDLDAGAYLVVLPRREVAQLVLQVTNFGVYAVSTETDTLVWLNNLRTVTPVAGAAVTSVDGRGFGATDGNGVARFATPPELRTSRPGTRANDDYYYDYWYAPDPRLVAVTAPDGRWIVAGLGSAVGTLDGRFDNAVSRAEEPSQRWWLLLNTDRDQYRETDTIHAWGLIRSRDDGALPDDVRLELYPLDEDWDSGEGGAPIANVPVALNRSGAFAVDVATTSLPRSYYRLDLMVAGVRAQSTWLEVADIRKPAYRIDLSTERYAYRDGEPIEVEISATFFDGSSVPGINLHVSTEGGQQTTITTDRGGRASVILRAEFGSGTPDGWTGQYIDVVPVRPEEGAISGDVNVVVFPSDAWLTGTARLSGKTITIDGLVSSVALKAIDARHATNPWDWDGVVAGRPLAGRPVTATITRTRYVRVSLGTRYDYLEKQVVQVYEWRRVRDTIGTFQTTSKANGTYRLSATVPSANDGYEIAIRSSDAAGRPVRTEAYASARIDRSRSGRPSYLFASNGCGFRDSVQLDLDATARVTMHDGDGRIAKGRFLFLVANRGLRDVTLSDSASFTRVLREGDLPGFTIRAVQVTGEGYATADADVNVETGSLALQVHLRPDRARYAPGDRVTVAVTTLGPDGEPVAADVVVQGVDEKLFAIGAAHEADVLRDLYQWVGPGFLQSYASHRIPLRSEEGGCGATGGGARDSFGDVVTSQLVRTGEDGRATVSFDLLDDITSWHLNAMAITDGLRAGSESVLIPVGLPFFVESVLAPEYLVGEAPVLRVRAYGDGLLAGDTVRFTVSAPSLGLAATTVEGRAFEAARVAIPELTLGEHQIRVEGRGPDAGMRDAVVRAVSVIPTRLTSLVKSYDQLTAGFVPQGGDGLTTYAITDAGRGSLLSTLLDMSSTSSARFDMLAAADVARRLLIDEFGYHPGQLRDPGFDPSRFQRSGIALLPYASVDTELSALTALIAPERMNLGLLRGFLEGLTEGESRETRIMALAGLAGLGEDALERLRAFTSESLTIRESLWLALGFVAVGDENAARSIERELLAAHGERYGPWVRLGVGSNTEDTVNAARLLLVLSARLGEPIAPDVLRYIDEQGSSERALALERLAYVMASLERLPRAPGRFAWTVDGERHEVELRAGGTATLVFNAPQRATLALEPLAGELAVVTSWSGLGGSLPSGGGVSITRTVTPLNDAREDQLVRIVIRVNLGNVPYNGCWQIRDVAPSGLAPVGWDWSWPYDDDEGYSSWRDGPYDIDGQTVFWCRSRSDPNRDLVYTARVVSPGSYTWQPAVLQAIDAPELGASTPEVSFTIR